MLNINTNSAINWGSIVSGVGLLGLSIFQFTQRDFTNGVQSFLASLAAFGLNYQNQLHVALKAQLQRRNML